ncbi:MAG TPA: CaiB/BaiF CoA-transferase family protein, partial [Aestuariivirgaceae bacterium]|nr:CaiB/BaiF CoA-transferase family protein [Aestuariivirgaceae bacterium]
AHRERTGEGQHIDMALLDSQVAVLANQALNYLVSGSPPVRQGNAHPNIVPYQAFATADGHVILAIGNDRQFAAFCRIAGLDDVPADPRFATNRTRVANRLALVPLVAEVMASRTTGEWVAVLEHDGVPCGPINSIDQVFADEQVKARGLRVDLARPDGTVVPGVANPIRLSNSPIEYSRPAPALGADTDEVLARLGLCEAEIRTLREARVVG